MPTVYFITLYFYSDFLSLWSSLDWEWNSWEEKQIIIHILYSYSIIEERKVLNIKTYCFAGLTVSKSIINTFSLSTLFLYWANLHLQN